MGVKKERDGQELSVGDEETIWSDRELRVAIGKAWLDGWNGALDAVGARRVVAGGVGSGMVGGEGSDLRRLVGERFANGLEGVWLASLRYLRSTVRGDNGGMRGAIGRGVVRRATGLTDRSLVMKGTGGRRGRGGAGDQGGLIADEAALAFKSKIDRQLRKLTREMESWLERRSSLREENGAENAALRVRKCVRCRRYAEEKWQYCPFDGEVVK